MEMSYVVAQFALCFFHFQRLMTKCGDFNNGFMSHCVGGSAVDNLHTETILHNTSPEAIIRTNSVFGSKSIESIEAISLV